ncbi:MAG: hypothetical protein HY698_03095 [Deltaproteobacteria bacterium]|nr:hypothetical protein [Deltaproteobacteria bacterium]
MVSGIDSFGNSKGGIYVQEAKGGAFSGVYVFKPTVADGSVADLAVGDLVTIEGGVVDEYAYSSPTGTGSDTNGTLTEISPPKGGTILVKRTGKGTAPQPQKLDPTVLAADPAEAEKWEGVLVVLENVAVTSAPRTVGDDVTLQEMTVTGPFRVSSSLASLDGVKVDSCYSSITGIVDYFFNYKLLPRQAGDLVEGTTSSCKYETGDSCGNQADDDFDGFVDCDDHSCLKDSCANATIAGIQKGEIQGGTKVRLGGVVVTARAKEYLWVQEKTGGPFSGIVIYQPSGTDASLELGDTVAVSGTVDEFPDPPEAGVTQLTGARVVKTGHVDPLSPAGVDLAPLADPTTAEQYEGVLITVSNVKVLTAPDTYGEWTIGGDKPVRVDDMFLAGDTGYKKPEQGACFSSIAGVFHFSFKNYKIEPRSVGDLAPTTCQ